MKQSIINILADSATSDAARQYLTSAILAHGGRCATFEEAIVDFANANHRYSAFGINVVRNDHGKPCVVYGYIDYLNEGSEQANCDLDALLTIIESRDAIPMWWEDKWTAVFCIERSGSGFRTQADIDATYNKFK